MSPQSGEHSSTGGKVYIDSDTALIAPKLKNHDRNYGVNEHTSHKTGKVINTYDTSLASGGNCQPVLSIDWTLSSLFRCTSSVNPGWETGQIRGFVEATKQINYS